MATLLTSSPGSGLQGPKHGCNQGGAEERPEPRSLLHLRGVLGREHLPACLGDWGPRQSGSPLPPKPAMWQLKEPSKPKCVCAHTQFITAEHMANILTHVSRARKTNRARAARGSGPLRLGCAAASGPGAGRVGPRGREPKPGGGALAGRPRLATARAPATPQLGIKSCRGPARSRSPVPSG